MGSIPFQVEISIGSTTSLMPLPSRPASTMTVMQHAGHTAGDTQPPCGSVARRPGSPWPASDASAPSSASSPLAGAMGQQRVQVLDAVGRLERSAQLLEQAQTVDSERLLETFVQAGYRRLIQQAQLTPHLLQGRLRLGVRGLVISSLQLPTERRLLARR